MRLSRAGRAFGALLSFSLFLACGEMTTLFSPDGSYQVRTLVNGSSIEDCSLIRSSDKIRPYFATSVVNDPDLIGLLVYLEDANGEIVGERVRYTLPAYAVGSEQEEETETLTETGEAENPDETNNENANNTGESYNENEIEETEAGNETGRSLWDLPKEGAIMERRVFTDTKPEVKSTDVEIIVKSFVQELPHFPLPKALGIGAYILVFEALGEKETLSRTETDIFYIGSVTFNLKDIAVYLPEVSGSQLIPPGTTVMLEALIDFDSRLDPYVIWYNGRTIISQGKINDGAGKILWKAPEQAGFYSLRLEAFPYQLKRGFSGFSREASLPVSPKAVSAGYFFDNSAKQTAQTSLSSGTVYQEQVRLVLSAKITESSEDDNTEKKDTATLPAALPVMPLPPELLHWYRLGGNLIDALSPPESQALVPLDSTTPRWMAKGQSYGLSIGADDAYSLPSINFFRVEKDQGGGIFLFHITPPAEGTIFNAFFPLQSSATDGVWMDMARENNVIVLRLNTGRTVVEIPVYLPYFSLQGFIPVVVEFYIRPYRLEAKLSLGEASYQQGAAKYILLPDALTGEARIRLGYQQGKTVQMREVKSGFVSVSPATEDGLTASTANPTIQTVFHDLTESQTGEISPEITALADSALLDNAVPDNLEELFADIPAIPVATEYHIPVDTIWNEFAVLFSATPLVPEEDFAEIIPETEAVSETKAVESGTEEPLESNAVETATETALPAALPVSVSVTRTASQEPAFPVDDAESPAEGNLVTGTIAPEIDPIIEQDYDFPLD